MNIGIIGLGRMGSAIASRLIAAKFQVFGFDRDSKNCQQVETDGIVCVSDLAELAQQVKTFWLMVPAGDPVDQVIAELRPHLKNNMILIDGGNSNYSDSVRRAKSLKKDGVNFLDCGTSGGLHGKELGFSLMIGGEKNAYEQCIPFFKAIAMPGGFGLVGPSGAGHYVKMVHNGIEYALLQAYAEGLHLLRDGQYKDLDLAQITEIWQHGSIIRSWILELAHSILEKDQKLDTVSGKIFESGTGMWTVQEAEREKIPVALIKEALEIRAHSRKSGGTYATKLVALLRHAFGGHPLG